MELSAKLYIFLWIWVCFTISALEATGKPIFKKLILSRDYISEGVAVADIDGDGNKDVIAGIYWWKGPDFKNKIQYTTTGKRLNTYQDQFFNFTQDIDGDGRLDILSIGIPGSSLKVYLDPVNNGIQPGIELQLRVAHESPHLVDLIGGKDKELVFVHNRTLGYSKMESGSKQWKFYPVGGSSRIKAHGLGVGDINGDHLKDIVAQNGWFEQPEAWDKKQWKFHKAPFGNGQGGAQMGIFDVDGDGDPDVVSAINAHGYGLSWFENKQVNHTIKFKEWPIMSTHPEKKSGEVQFSQLHALGFSDMNGDGLTDIVTGKCYHAHEGNGKDPGFNEPAVLVWFELKRTGGIINFIPHLIDDNSGVGRQISVVDINKDGKKDIATSNRKGVHLFIQI